MEALLVLMVQRDQTARHCFSEAMAVEAAATVLARIPQVMVEMVAIPAAAAAVVERVRQDLILAQAEMAVTVTSASPRSSEVASCQNNSY